MNLLAGCEPLCNPVPLLELSLPCTRWGYGTDSVAHTVAPSTLVPSIDFADTVVPSAPAPSIDFSDTVAPSALAPSIDFADTVAP